MSNTILMENMRTYFNSGGTRSYEFRKLQLTRLKDSILAHEQQLYNALQADLNKSREETWVTEIGMVISEINVAIRNLRAWMRPEPVPTNLLNLPSSSKVIREPLGVVLIIGPWNYPFQLLINPLVGAIAAGNCAVLKPSEFSTATSELIKKIIESAFAPEYIQVINGDGATVIPARMKDFRFDHIFYTGSTAVGQIIYKLAAERLVPVTLELGGKSPCVVESDANIKVAAKRIVVTKFSNAGQMCVAPDYIIAHNKIRAELITEMIQAITRFYGDKAENSYNYGRIINHKHFDRITKYLQQGKIEFGGRYDKTQLFIEPTLLSDVQLDSELMKDEIFGPILPVFGFDEPGEAKAIIEQNPNPLSFYIFTGSKKNEEKWLDLVPSGGACVNNSSWHLTNHNLPFGGRGNSGTGNYHGRYSFETFSHRKAVMKTPSWFDPAIKYPPFKGKLSLFKRIIK